MPIIGRRPSTAIRETGEVLVITSEASQRSRGKTILRDPDSQSKVIRVDETPVETERLTWLCSIGDGKPPVEPAFTPVLILENDSLYGMNPKTARYLRNGMNPEIQYFSDSGEVQMYWWENTFTPLENIPVINPCSSVEMKPNSIVSQRGTWLGFPDFTVTGPQVQLLSREPQSLNTNQAISTQNSFLHANLIRDGSLTVSLEPRNGNSVQPQESWGGATLRIALSRISLPDGAIPQYGLPLVNPQNIIYNQSSLNGPFKDPYPSGTARVTAKLTVNGVDSTFLWEDGTYELNLKSTGGLNSLELYTASLQPQDPIFFNQNITLNLEFNVTPQAYPMNGPFLGILIASVEVQMDCSPPNQGLVDSFYSSYREYPAPYTLKLTPGEPHFVPQTKRDPKFNSPVGDPPVDPGQGWPGVYNQFTVVNTLNLGGVNSGRNWSPFPATNAHQRLPVTPGIVRYTLAQEKGSLVSLEAVNDFMLNHTQNVYQQRELQDLRFGTRTLMHARGTLQMLIAEEEPPPAIDSPSPSESSLIIGASNLIPGVLGENYVGENYINLRDSAIIFPFGASIAGPFGSFISFSPGEVGHQFTVNGGEPPYKWTIRPTRSGQYPFIPRIVFASPPPPAPPAPPTSPPPLPFDPFGNYQDPLVEFPQALMGGGLPPGILLNKQGLLYGKPLLAGTFLFRIHVRDKNGKHAEATVRMVVLSNPNEFSPCNGIAPPSVLFKTTIAQVILPPIVTAEDALNWKGKVLAIGGNQSYIYSFPNAYDYPNQLIPSTSTGSPLIGINAYGALSAPGLNSSNYQNYIGLWLWEVEVKDTSTSGQSTCDRRTLTLIVGVESTAGEGTTVLGDGGSMLLPEGDYMEKNPSRQYLILDSPTAVRGFPQAKSVFMRGARGTTLRPDLGGPHIGPGPITSTVPGVINPVSVVGMFETQLAPAHVQLDYVSSNPVSYFRDTVDRFKIPTIAPPSSPPPPPGFEEAVVEGASIDHQIPVGKRIRPLWPV